MKSMGRFFKKTSLKGRLQPTPLVLSMLICLLTSGGAASGVVVTLPDTTARTGTTFRLPVIVDEVTDQGIIAYQFTLSYQEDVLEALGVEVEGYLGGQWNIDPTVNTNVPGEVTVVHYGVAPLSGSGVLIMLELEVLSNPGDTTQLRFDSFVFNDGDPQAEISDPAAIFTVTFTGVPILSVFPDTLDFGESDTVRALYVSNVGVGTLDWSMSEDPELAWITDIRPATGADDDTVAVTVSRQGMSSGSYSGWVRVRSNGGHRKIRVSMTVPQEVLVVTVTIPDTSQYKSRRVELPVRVEDVTGMEIIAYRFSLIFDESVINAVGASTQSSLSAGWGSPTVNTDTTGQITVAHYGPSPLVGEGKLVSVICYAVGNPGDSTDLAFGRFLFNDGYPYVDCDTPAAVFSVDTADVPLLLLSPTVLDFGSTETVKTFDILNLGTDTLTWSVFEDPGVSWITSVSPLSGEGEETVTVAVSRIGLEAGLYSAKVSITSNGGDGTVTVTLSVPGGGRRVLVSLPDTTAALESEITIPVRVNDVTPFGIVGFQFTLNFDERVMEVAAALAEATLCALWGPPEVDLATPGQVTVGHQGPLPLAGRGTLIGLRVKAVGDPEDSSELTLSTVLFNGDSSVAQYETPAGTFRIERPDYPLLSVSATLLDFGPTAAAKSFTITNLGTGTLRWSVFENPEVDWITSVFPTDGTNQGTVTVIVNRTGLYPGPYTGGLYVASNGGYRNIDVRMEVEETDTLPPYMVFSSPQHEAISLARNAPIYVIVEDTDSDVSLNTVWVEVDADTIVSEGNDRTEGAVSFFQRTQGVGLVYTPRMLFAQDYEVVVSVRAEDTALPSHVYEGGFSFTTGAAIVEVTSRATLASEGGTLADTSGVLVTLPPGVLRDSLAIIIGTVTDPPPLADTVAAVGRSFFFGPDGLAFCPLPGVGRLVYTEEDLAAAGVADPSELMVFCFDSKTGEWEPRQVLSIDPEDRTVLFQICRFGYLTLGVVRTTSVGGEYGIQNNPTHFFLKPCRPNPFNSSTHILFEIPEVRCPVGVTVSIYNLLGEEVRALFQRQLSQGRYGLIWDGRHRSGREMPSGLYFCRMSVEDSQGSEMFVQARKVLLLR